MNENSIIKYTIQNDTRIKRLTQALATSFGITDFWHYSVYPDGVFFEIGNNPDIFDYYWGSGVYKESSLFRHPDQVKSPVLLSNTLRDTGFQNSQKNVQTRFQMQFPFHITRVKRGIYHGFGFSTRDEKIPLDTVCMLHLGCLQQFCNYFLENTKDIQQKLVEEQFRIDLKIGSAFHQPFPFCTVAPFKLKHFHKSLKKTIFEPSLTPREIDCFSLFLEGYCYREIGEILNLSTRTIETYFLKIKEKLNCGTKSELFQKGKEWQQFGLLSSSSKLLKGE